MKKTLAMVAASTAWLWGASFAQALDCPKPQPLDASGKAPALAADLGSPQILNQIPGLLAALHSQFPSASKPQLVDYLVASYCPVVKADGKLSAQEQDAKVKLFADAAVAAAY